MTEQHREPHVDVSGLLTGEPPPSARSDALAHVRGCADCRDRFVVLGAAMGEVRDAVRHAPVEPGEVPPLRLDRSEATTSDDARPAGAPVPIAAVRPRGRLLVRVAVGVAAAVLLVAAGFGAGRALTDDPADPEQAAPGATVPLVAVGSTSGPVAGAATMTGEGVEQEMAIALVGLAAPDPGTHYTIWLIDTVGGRAREVGVMPESDASVMRAVFALPAEDAVGYDALKVSVEDDEVAVTEPTHSLLSGTLA